MDGPRTLAGAGRSSFVSAPQPVTAHTNMAQALREDEELLVIRVDLTKDLGLSSTGKTRIIATMSGNAEVPGHEDVKLGLNVSKKA